MSAHIPLLDLGGQFAGIEGEIRQAIDRVLSSQRFILGEEVSELEVELAKRLGVKHAIGCASGSDALFLALRALAIGSGDEVITSSFSFVATAESIVRVGATP